MIRNNNVYIGSGNVVEKPTLRKAGEAEVTTVRVAINTGKDSTMFINVECWRNNATFACQYFDKGSRVGFVGSLKQKEWTDKEGTVRKEIVVEAENISFDGPPAKKDGEATAPTAQPAEPAATPKTAPAKVAAKSTPKKVEEDLPF